jgi:hypothetical protein
MNVMKVFGGIKKVFSRSRLCKYIYVYFTTNANTVHNTVSIVNLFHLTDYLVFISLPYLEGRIRNSRQGAVV